MTDYTMRTPSNLVEAGFMILILATSFRTTLETMAKEHDYKHGPWFEELASSLTLAAKNSSYDGAHEVEAAGVGLGLELLTTMLDVVRRQLVAEDGH